MYAMYDNKESKKHNYDGKDGKILQSNDLMC